MLNMQEFGKRVQAIREQVLNMSQSELAEKINTSQVLLSRIENGIGGSINVVFDLVNYLNSKNIAAKEIFGKQFSIDRVVQVPGNSKKARTQIEKKVKELQKSMSADFDKLLLLLSLQEENR
jgi:transcriptional regulator with XRE-family HTH domain